MRAVYSILLVFSFIAGCSSVIKVPESDLKYSHKMFGINGGREFFYDYNVSDSVKLCWLAETHGGFAPTSVTVKNGAVFIGDLSGRVFCFDFITGKEIGEIKTKGVINSSVILNENKIIYPLELQNSNLSSVIIYDVKTGDEVKNVKLPGKISSEIIYENDEIFVVTQEGWLYLLNLKGEQVWSYNFGSSVISPPVTSGSNVFVMTADGQLKIIDFYRKQLISTVKLKGRFESGMSIKNNILYTCSNEGIVFAVDVLTDKILWQFDSKFRIKIYPVADSSSLYIANLKGEIFSLSLKEGSMKWKTETDGLFEAAPIAAGDFLIVPDQNKKILFVAKNSGQITKVLNLEGRNKLSPVIVDKYLFIGYEKGKIAKYEFVR